MNRTGRPTIEKQVLDYVTACDYHPVMNEYTGEVVDPSSLIRKIDPQLHTILIIDDDDEQLELLRCILTDSSYRVITACSVDQAFKVIMTRFVDLIICDILMPSADGFKFVSTLRSLDIFPRHATLPVILTTASSRDMESKSLHFGADMFCPKKRAQDLLKKQIRFLLE